MTRFKFDIPMRPTTDKQYDEWVELLNRAPAGEANEWRKAVLQALITTVDQSSDGCESALCD